MMLWMMEMTKVKRIKNELFCEKLCVFMTFMCIFFLFFYVFVWCFYVFLFQQLVQGQKLKARIQCRSF